MLHWKLFVLAFHVHIAAGENHRVKTAKENCLLQKAGSGVQLSRSKSVPDGMMRVKKAIFENRCEHPVYLYGYQDSDPTYVKIEPRATEEFVEERGFLPWREQRITLSYGIFFDGLLRPTNLDAAVIELNADYLSWVVPKSHISFLGQLGFSNLNLELALWLDRINGTLAVETPANPACFSRAKTAFNVSECNFSDGSAKVISRTWGELCMPVCPDTGEASEAPCETSCFVEPGVPLKYPEYISHRSLAWVLSPIFEGSHEDSKSTNSSHSSNGSSRRGSSSASASHHNGLELSKIQEETSICQTSPSPEANNGGCSVVNPFAGDVVNDFLLRINPPLSTYEGFVTSSKEIPRIATNASVSLGDDDTYHVEKLIGSGAFAKVYLANKRGDVDEDDFETDDESAVVLKVQRISIEWEFYVSRQLQKRIKARGYSKELLAMFMNPVAAFVYSNSSVLVDKYKPLGTILDMVNKYKMKNKTMEEGVVFYYTIALLRILETLHACDVIHGDIKPDNFLVLDSDVDTLDGACLKLIDFGRSIDMTLFPAGTTFNTNCYTEDFQCVEMKESRPWTTQVDTYGLLGTIHCFIFLDYMKVFKDEKGRWKITKSFRRYWNPIWEKLFDSLLNTPSCAEQPSLRGFREEFERLYLEDEDNYSRQRQQHEVLMF